MPAVATQALKSIRERSIRVLVTPTPVTFAERRAVLQVLEQHGPVEVFKMTPGYHSNFVSVTKSPVSASRLVDSSPLCYSLPAPREAAELSLDGPAEPATLDELESAPDRPHRDFKLEVFPEPDYRHRLASESPLRQPWPAVYEQDHSFIAATLKQSLPRTIAAKGLAHWFLNPDQVHPAHKARRQRLKSWLPSQMKA